MLASSTNAGYAAGCPGAVYGNGKPAEGYCTNRDGRFPWHEACCAWNEGGKKCVPKPDCTVPPPSTNRGYASGCAGAVWSNGKPAETYCANNDGRFPWHGACCAWDEGDKKCVTKESGRRGSNLLPSPSPPPDSPPVLELILASRPRPHPPPPVHAVFSCWIQMPSGCSKVLSESTTPTMWFVDPANTGNTCSAGRLAAFNSYCGKNDAKNRWGIRPINEGRSMVEGQYESLD